MGFNGINREYVYVQFSCIRYIRGRFNLEVNMLFDGYLLEITKISKSTLYLL